MPTVYPYSAGPALSSSPTGYYRAVTTYAVVDIYFDGPITPGAGNIVLHRASDGAVLRSVAVTDSDHVSYDGGSLHVDFQTLLDQSARYYVTFDPGTVVGLTGQPCVGVTSAAAINFPGYEAGTVHVQDFQTAYSWMLSNVQPRSDFLLFYNTPVVAGSGSIELHRKSDGALIESIPVGDTSRVSIYNTAEMNSRVLINPNTILGVSSEYYFVLPEGVFTDPAGDHSVAYQTSTFTTAATDTDTSPPLLTSSTPTSGETSVDRTPDIKLLFNENIARGAGTIEIHKSADGSLVESFSTLDGDLIFVTNEIYFYPYGWTLEANTSYYITVSPGAIKDKSGNAFVGITSSTALTFTTDAGYVDPATTILQYPQGRLVIGAGESRTNTNGAALFDFGGQCQVYDHGLTLENFGILTVSGPATSCGVKDGGLANGLFVNRNTLTVTGGNAYGTSVYGTIGVKLTANFGTISVRADGQGMAYGVCGELANWGTLTVSGGYVYARGVYDYTPNQSVTNQIGGLIDVTGRGYTEARAVELHNGGTVYNAGTISATSDANHAYAIWADGGVNVVNDGSIVAVANGTAGLSGVDYSRSYGIAVAGLTNTGRPFSIVNNGTITAETAITTFDNGYSPSQYPAVNLTNAGQINGNIYLGPGDTFLDNSGTINGAVSLGTDSNLLTNSGAIHGDITLAAGNDTYDGRLGTLLGVADGGMGNDMLLGGRGDDILRGGEGDDLIDGGAGSDTVSYADVWTGIISGPLTVNLALTGPQAVGANQGLDTLVNIENIIGSSFADTLNGDSRANMLAGGTGNDTLFSGDEHDTLTGGAGNDALDGGSNIDTAVFAGNTAAYTITQGTAGVFTISGGDGTDTLSNVEYAKFADKTVRLLPGSGTTVDWSADPSTYMTGIRDFDGNDVGAAAGWKLIGTADVNGDGVSEHILVNRQNGRWAELSTESDGKTYFANNGWAGDTRVVGIYIDPLVTSGEVVAGSDFDSQRRFQNDLNIENIHGVLGQNDYNHDGLQEIYFSLTDGTAYLHAYMHADGNIQYANYQNEQQVKDYLTSNGFTSAAWAGWFPSSQTALAGVAG